MTTWRLRRLFVMQNLWTCGLMLAMLLPSLAYADGPGSKAPDDELAAEKPDSKVAEESPVAENPDPNSAEDKAGADNPKPETAEDREGAEEAEPKAPEETPVNVDLTLMGEFVGTVATGPSRFRQIGLQIRATGGGTFEAAQHLGGLPKRRARPKQPTTLIGKRNDDFLVLSGGPWAVFVESNRCLLIDRDGNRMGQLDRVERQSPTLGAKPPEDAIVLFDGSGTEQFTGARMTEDGLLMEGAFVKPLVQDFNLHMEFMIPYVPAESGQGRGNSGVYLQSRYEVQILDSFALAPQSNGCGGLYRFREPDVNMCFPPLAWQTYDIVFTSTRWNSDGTKRKNARLTVWHNGVKIHNNVELPDKTGAGKPEELTLLPIRIQDHGDPVRFRNIWLIDRGDTRPARFPPRPKPTRDGKT